MKSVTHVIMPINLNSTENTKKKKSNPGKISSMIFKKKKKKRKEKVAVVTPLHRCSTSTKDVVRRSSVSVTTVVLLQLILTQFLSLYPHSKTNTYIYNSIHQTDHSQKKKEKRGGREGKLLIFSTLFW